MAATTTTDASECALPQDRKDRGAVCSSPETVRILASFISERSKSTNGGDLRVPASPVDADGGVRVPEPEGGAKAVVKAAARKLGCDGERCVVEHPSLADFIEVRHGPDAVKQVRKETKALFKPKGPRNDTSLLSNFDIDEVMARWAGEPAFSREGEAFFNCPFSMMDFDREDYTFGHENLLKRVLKGTEMQVIAPLTEGGVDPKRKVARKCRMFGCILNTDVSSGQGKHWVCVFVDMRGNPTSDTPWTVEYFNSAGNAPPRLMGKWLARTTDCLIECLTEGEVNVGASSEGAASALVKAVSVTSMTHQRSKTECGPYTMYYIRSRLDGTPWKHFTQQRTSDSEMTAFRKHLFS